MDKLLIVDKNPLELVGLKLLFKDRKTEIQTESTSKMPALLERVTELAPNVVLIDCNSYDDIIDEVTIQIKRKQPEVKVLWLLLEEDEQITYDALSARADGCVLKCDLDQISSAVDVVLSGDVFYTRQLLAKFAYEASLVIDHLGRKVNRLTDREKQVLQLVRYGSTNDEIARELYISVETVKAHIRSIRETLGVANRRQMICCLRPPKETAETAAAKQA